MSDRNCTFGLYSSGITQVIEDEFEFGPRVAMAHDSVKTWGLEEELTSLFPDPPVPQSTTPIPTAAILSPKV